MSKSRKTSKSIDDKLQDTPSPGQVKALKRQVADLQKALDALRSSKFVLPTGKRTRSKKGSYTRVIIPDTHGCLLDKTAWRAFMTDLEAIQPAEIVWLGDHLDCGGFLAQHHTANYVAQTEYTFADDAAAANAQLDAVLKAVPGATHHYLEGNHERRIETFIATSTVRNERDAKYLRQIFSPEVVLGIEDRGVNYYKQSTCYHDLEIPNIIKLGRCYFTHGIFTSKNAAKAHVDEYACNIVYGHTHRADSYVRRTIDSTIAAHNPGCLCRTQKLYMHSRNTHHTHGYGLQAVQGNGDFLHINVPIIKGKSLLQPLASGVVS